MSASSTNAAREIIKRQRKELTAEQKKLRAAKRRARRAQAPKISVVAGPPGPVSIRGSVPRLVNSAVSGNGRLLSPIQKKACIAYMKALMTGEDEGDLSMVPRKFPVKCSKSPVKHVQNLPYMNHDPSSSDPRQGVAGVEVYRSLAVPLRVWTIEEAAATNYQLLVQGQSPYSGLWPSVDGEVDEGLVNSVMELDSSDALNPVGLVSHGALSAGFGSFMRKATASDGTVFYGTPVDWTGTTNISVDIAMTSNAYFTNAFNVQARFVSTSGVTDWTDGNVAVSGTSTHVFLTTVTIADAVADLGGVFSCCLPDAPFGIQIRSKNSTEVITSLRITWTSSATAKLGWMRPTELSNLDSYKWVQSASFANLRAWVEYVGSDFMNSGTISAITSPGGIPPSLAGYVGYSENASYNDSYVDAVKNGDWSWWKPQTEEDLEFYPRADVLRTSCLTSYVIWAKIGAPPTGQAGQTDSLNLVVKGNIEGLTRDTTRSLSECIANPLAMTIILSLLAHIRAHMENPLHWKDIKTFLSKAARTIKGGADFVINNKDWLIPAALKVAGAAGIALL